jgi:glycosyltransferase involved in cell wall biosynthesis
VPELWVVSACFNEGSGISAFVAAVRRQPAVKRLVLVDDGSRDGTAALIQSLIAEDNHLGPPPACPLSLIRLSRNFGKEAAMLAGLDYARGRCGAVVLMDSDLQDPPELIGPMVEAWREGHQVVNAVRHDRSSDSRMKRLSSHGFYSLFLRLSKLQVQFNASDFRLLDRVAIDAILACGEKVRFSKGFFAWIGFDQKNITFKRPARLIGASKWGGWKLWNYALDGIFNFSTAPLRIWSYLGLTFTVAAFLVGLAAVIRVLFFGIDVPGYASLFFAVTFLGGLQLIGIGILGEYVGRIYLEVKNRPTYLIRSVEEGAGPLSTTSD